MRFEILHPADDNEKKRNIFYIYMTIAAALGAEQCRDPAADDFPDFSRTSGDALGQRALIYYCTHGTHIHIL